MVEVIVREAPPTLQPELVGLTRDPYLSQTKAKPASYIDVFVDNFLEITQEPDHWRN